SGVYLAATVACHAGALLPHPFTLTRRNPQKRWAGGLLSVALARRSPWVPVSNHCALWSPDFPRHGAWPAGITPAGGSTTPQPRSEEHTSELQSRFDLVCRLLLEK